MRSRAGVVRATAARANTIYAQVRRRGDSWYLDSLEPAPDNTPLAPGFDPLRDSIVEAHGRGLEVHAFVIVNAIWNRAPNLFPPSTPAHVFNRHGGYDAVTNTITPGTDTCLTRMLLPDGSAGITLQGHRFGSEFYIDPGHPAAESTRPTCHCIWYATTMSTACISTGSATPNSPSVARRRRHQRREQPDERRAVPASLRHSRGCTATLATIPAGASGSSRTTNGGRHATWPGRW